MQAAVQRSFCVKPRDKTVGLPFVDKIDRELMVAVAVDGEGDPDAVLVECVGPHSKVPDKKYGGCQCNMNCTGEYQKLPFGAQDHRRRSIGHPQNTQKRSV